MNIKLQNKILKKYKYIDCTIDCGDGWFNLINDLCKNIQNELNKRSNKKLKEEFKVNQIKEKFGGLRFYTYCDNEQIHKLIDIAETLSFKTCECCGRKGKLCNVEGWLTTLCGDCANRVNNEKL
jgi:hypothetical protein